MNKTWYSIIGFLLFLIGLIALILSLVGLRLQFLSFIDHDPLIGLLVKLAMIFSGIIMVYITRTSFDE